MYVNVTNLSTNDNFFNGDAEELLELANYDIMLENVLNHMDTHNLNSIKFTDDDDNEYLIEKELELIYD